MPGSATAVIIAQQRHEREQLAAEKARGDNRYQPSLYTSTITQTPPVKSLYETEETDSVILIVLIVIWVLVAAATALWALSLNPKKPP